MNESNEKNALCNQQTNAYNVDVAIEKLETKRGNIQKPEYTQSQDWCENGFKARKQGDGWN